MRASPARVHPPETAPARMTAVALDEMPIYPDVLVHAVERAIADLPRGKLWFTYRDIKDHFGVSRATVARRLRDRLVPGVRMEGDHVLEDGAVRRFDRMQLRWLLLAVRCRGQAGERDEVRMNA